MLQRTTRLRVRRAVRSRKRQVEDIGYQAEDHFERHFFKRLSRLFNVRRFVLGWITLLVLLVTGVGLQLRGLSAYYQQLKPASGGTYTEGMIGSFSNANPLYATGIVDSSVSRLVFSGLLKYDQNNKLVGDLAESWSLDPDGKVYKVVLKPGLKWHDGQDLTSDDVVFTFQTIQNPDAKSPLFRGWQGVTIKALDNRTVTFTLSTPLAPFVYGLTTGIVPKHLLANVEPAQLRSSPFNTSRPVGAGPFSWTTIEIRGNETDGIQQQIGLKASDTYTLGRPKLDEFVIRTFPNQSQLEESFKKRELTAIAGLDRVPDTIAVQADVQEYSVPLSAETMVFFKTDSDILKEVKVRQALEQSLDVPGILQGLGYPVVLANEPFLRGQVGYNAAYKQAGKNLEQANKLLDEAGWKRAESGGTRQKDGKPLTLRLFAPNSADYVFLTQQLQSAWRDVGVAIEVTLPADEDLQPIISSREYDVLLYGISIGADPDVFAYWHSSQADPHARTRLNFSNYRSTSADKALEAGRTREEASLRAAKYAPFLQAWAADVPAVALYQPRFLYISQGQVFGFDNKTINTAANRFSNVHNWMIRLAPDLKD